MNFDTPSTLRLSCGSGQRDVLAAELEQLGIRAQQGGPTGVECQGTLLDAMKLNLVSRIAMRVLYRLESFACTSPEQLREAASHIPWEDIVPLNGYLSVTCAVNHPSIDNTMFASLTLKDAIVDRIGSTFGRRPDSGPDRTGAVIHLHWHGETAQIWIDTSGQKLADRGYRKTPYLAPLRETLAAAILMRAGYTGEGPLVIPMCGSGTLAIEGALIAAGRPPGLLRSGFGFQHLVAFNKDVWNDIRREVTPAKPRRGGKACPPIIATDINPDAVAATKRNAETAGVGHLIETQVCDFADTPMPDEHGHIILHPEYGLRLGKQDDLQSLYPRMGDFFKQRCGGWSSWIYTGNLELAKRIGLKPACRVPMRNAKIDARLLGYEVWEGSRASEEHRSTPT
ncbi:MAG TPA: RNA methyltransferase [Phycisphaerales bacterium]|jgi:putative N6-adenine-specific DNA methylase|nr:RNA methyltransferase [Phycisphaerales bacterium]|tara:strand:- start:37 stop:1227 length:1191 start_codon:yes stop_codon:yes gene_type:complete